MHVENERKEGDDKGQKWEDGLTENNHRWHWNGRVGKVDDILKAVDYLLGSGGFVTGQ